MCVILLASYWWLIISDGRQTLYPAEVLAYEVRAKGLAFLGIASGIATLINTFGWVVISLHWYLLTLFFARLPVALEKIGWKGTFVHLQANFD